MSPLQQQRPLVGDGTRLWAVWWAGDKFCFVPVETPPVIPAEAQRRAGTPKDFAARGPGLADAFGDDDARNKAVLRVRPRLPQLARWDRRFAAIIIKATVSFPTEPAGFHIFYQKRAWAIFRVCQAFIQDLHDRQNGVEADEVR